MAELLLQHSLLLNQLSMFSYQIIYVHFQVDEYFVYCLYDTPFILIISILWLNMVVHCTSMIFTIFFIFTFICRFGVVDSMISIFDSVPRMAGSCEELAIGGQPSNLKVKLLTISSSVFLSLKTFALVYDRTIHWL